MSTIPKEIDDALKNGPTNLIKLICDRIQELHEVNLRGKDDIIRQKDAQIGGLKVECTVKDARNRSLELEKEAQIEKMKAETTAKDAIIGALEEEVAGLRDDVERFSNLYRAKTHGVDKAPHSSTYGTKRKPETELSRNPRTQRSRNRSQHIRETDPMRWEIEQAGIKDKAAINGAKRKKKEEAAYMRASKDQQAEMLKKVGEDVMLKRREKGIDLESRAKRFGWVIRGI